MVISDILGIHRIHILIFTVVKYSCGLRDIILSDKKLNSNISKHVIHRADSRTLSQQLLRNMFQYCSTYIGGKSLPTIARGGINWPDELNIHVCYF